MGSNLLPLQLRVAAHRPALLASPSQPRRGLASLLLPATLPDSPGSPEDVFKTQRRVRRGGQALCSGSPHEKPRPPHGSFLTPGRCQKAPEATAAAAPAAGEGRGLPVTCRSRPRPRPRPPPPRDRPNRPLRSQPTRGAARPFLRLPLCACARNPPPASPVVLYVPELRLTPFRREGEEAQGPACRNLPR